MSDHTDAEVAHLDAVRQLFGEADGPADKSELFSEDATWWNGLPYIPGAVGRTEHTGRDAIRNILPSQSRAPDSPGVDRYDLSTARVDDVVVLADGDWVVRQHTFCATTLGGQDYRNVYCFRVPLRRGRPDRVPHRALEHVARGAGPLRQLRARTGASHPAVTAARTGSGPVSRRGAACCGPCGGAARGAPGSAAS